MDRRNPSSPPSFPPSFLFILIFHPELFNFCPTRRTFDSSGWKLRGGGTPKIERRPEEELQKLRGEPKVPRLVHTTDAHPRPPRRSFLRSHVPSHSLPGPWAQRPRRAPRQRLPRGSASSTSCPPPLPAATVQLQASALCSRPS